MRVLENSGYRTLVADSPATIAGLELEDVALLIADVVLRGESGPALASKLRAQRPELAVLYMSGYSDSQIRDQYDIAAETCILHKPFTAAELLANVSEALVPAR